MRVDWSRNRAATYDLGGYLAGVGVNRNANNDPTFPWKHRISADYIETTTDTAVVSDPWLCYYLDSTARCNPAMVKTKLSFKKITEASDYVPLDYPAFTTPAIGELQRISPEEP